MVDLFIYESLEKAVHPNKEKSLLETVQAGGLIAWIIVAIGALAVLLILFRIVVLLGAGANAKRLLHRLEPLLERNEILAAQKICKRSHGACARVLGATLQMIHASRKRLEDTVSEAVLAELPRIERFGSAITVFAAVAPLLGLLGTVTGMISTFDVITEHGTGDPKLLSGGISEALITTQLGLCVAIPTLLVGTLLRGRARAIEGAMERAAVRVINLTHGREAATAGEGESGAAVQSNPRPSGGDEGTISDLETEESEAPRAAPGADGLVKEPA
jgi:biopolymer transport protein ExbB